MDITILPQFTVECGANGEIPFIIFSYYINGVQHTFDIFWFLSNIQTRALIHDIRDLSGIIFVLGTIVWVVKNFPRVIRGELAFQNNVQDIGENISYAME